MVKSYSLTGSAKQHELPTTELLNGEYGDKRGQEVFSAVECREKSAQKAGKTNAILEDRSGVILS